MLRPTGVEYYSRKFSSLNCDATKAYSNSFSYPNAVTSLPESQENGVNKAKQKNYEKILIV